MVSEKKKRIFPKNFLWGAATSAHQVEGNNKLSDWWAWEKAGNTAESGRACAKYELYDHDFSLAAELGHNSHRLSIEWSRLQRPDGSWDNSEWDHYKKVLSSLTAKGIKPVLTLNHFTLPKYIARQGAWLNRNIIDSFSSFAEKTASILGGMAEFWITINEPNMLAEMAYLKGEFPPCRRDYKESLTVLAHMAEAHAGAYEAIKSALDGNAKVGAAKALTAFHPCRKNNLFDMLAVKKTRWLRNHSFINSLMEGRLTIPGMPEKILKTKKSLDFIGINYYLRQFVRWQGFGGRKSFGKTCPYQHHPESGDITDMGWEVYPEGLYEVIKEMMRYRRPVMITENGIATDDDRRRVEFIRLHLKSAAKALSEGMPLIGYLHWSLLDNFEWTHGYSKKFGLVEVDFKSLDRKIKPSGWYFADIIKKGTF